MTFSPAAALWYTYVMASELGGLCIVLHGHLPYVLHHGLHPHGEAWLHEAAAETYLPLLEMIGQAALYNARPALTVGLTPILLEQLSHRHFKETFAAYLTERIDRARSDQREFNSSGDAHLAFLAGRWADWYGSTAEQFERIGRDIPGQFAARMREGHIQLLTSAATHAYLPLLLNDSMIRAQLSAGTETSRHHLGIQPTGMWLPECAYRPHCPHWMPAVLYDNPRDRPGLETFIAAAGVDHFFVDTPLVTNAQPMGVMEQGQFQPAGEAQLHWDHHRGWRLPMSAVGVVSEPRPPACFAFARHPRISEQVWSGAMGYPGAGEYLEFHRKHGEHGLRYHKITNTRTPLGEKEPYHPEDVKGKIYEQATHFCDTVRQVLREYRQQTGKGGVVLAPFDAELFGHWWFEGISFLRDVILTLNQDPEIKLLTTAEALEQSPPDKVMRLPEGSWGQNGNHSVWLNDQTRWMWEVEYRAEGKFLQLLHHLPWPNHKTLPPILMRMARQLLLMQSSDWPFILHSGGAVDYGIERFAGHATAFNRLTAIANHLAAGGELTPTQQAEIADVDAHDDIFPHLDLNWWM